MMHRAWSSIVEVPYCFSRSYVKFQGHTALKIVEFDPNWVFPDCNSSLNSPMAMKCCTKPETAKERCLIVFQGHPSNFKVTRYKTSPILTQIGRFQTVGRSQLSNPSDLPCLYSSKIYFGIDSLLWINLTNSLKLINLKIQIGLDIFLDLDFFFDWNNFNKSQLGQSVMKSQPCLFTWEFIPVFLNHDAIDLRSTITSYCIQHSSGNSRKIILTA